MKKHQLTDVEYSELSKVIDEYTFVQWDEKDKEDWWGKYTVAVRASVIIALSEGKDPLIIAYLLSVSPATIYNWWNRWEKEGVGGLFDRRINGRPRIADEQYLRVLVETIKKDPLELGYKFNFWTIARLRDYLKKKTGKSISESRLWALINDLGFRYKGPKDERVPYEIDWEGEDGGDVLRFWRWDHGSVPYNELDAFKEYSFWELEDLRKADNTERREFLERQKKNYNNLDGDEDDMPDYS